MRMAGRWCSAAAPMADGGGLGRAKLLASFTFIDGQGNRDEVSEGHRRGVIAAAECAHSSTRQRRLDRRCSYGEATVQVHAAAA
jgi:hypothetical protein